MSPVPEPFRAAFAGLEEHHPPDNRFHQCFGCGPGHPTGLHVRCFKTAEGVVSPIIIPRHYEGPPDAAHGGIVAAYSMRCWRLPSSGRRGGSRSPAS
jgi:hypothetical protein